jgi:hypothetical protein
LRVCLGNVEERGKQNCQRETTVHSFG